MIPFTLTMPKLSPTMERGVIAQWHKAEGEFVESGDLLVEIATDKATIEHCVLDAGWLRKRLVAEGEEAAVNQPIAIFTEAPSEAIEGYQPKPTGAMATAKEAGTQKSAAVTPVSNNAAAILPAATPQKRILASPLAKKLARELGLDLAILSGSGPGGRIMKKDLRLPQAAQAGGWLKESPQKEALPPVGAYEEIRLSPVRQVIAQRLQEAKATIPHFYVRQTIDAEPLMALREQLKSQTVNLTFNDMILKGCALALKKHPQINCGFNAAKNMLISFKTIDICVAVSIDDGVITPIVRYADHKNIIALSAEVKELSKKAKEGKLLPQEYQGGSFTVSNLGMYGVVDFQAIINPPQAALLAISAITDQPVIKNGAVAAGKLLNLSLSVDHRVIDGALAADFLKTLRGILEAPAILLL